MGDRVIAGRFELVRILGRGGMSEVWLARDVELGREVALKLHAPEADPARFEREARAAAALAHENVAAVYDYGEAGGRPYLVFPYLAGGSLEDRLESGRPLPDEETPRIAAEIAAGLAHAHERGVIHRDLKPSNVLFDAEGRAKLADFGIAQASGHDTLTDAGTVLGTAAYASPEQAAGEQVGPESDVYSFGVILFRMLTGRLPFEGRSAIELALAHRTKPAPSVASVRPDAPGDLAGLAAAALAKDPGARPRNGAAVTAALSTGLAEPATRILAPREPADATVVLRSPRQKPRYALRRLVIGALLAVAAAAGVAIALLTLPEDQAKPPPTASLPSGPSGPATSTSPASGDMVTTSEQPTTAPTTLPTTTTTPTGPTTTAPTTVPGTTTVPP